MVGLGRIASSLEEDPYRYKPCTHVGTLLHPKLKSKFQIASVIDRDENKIKKFFQRHKKLNSSTIPYYTDLNKFQNLEQCQLGIIATNSESHTSIAMELIQKGIKNILIEKPMSLDLKSGRKLQKLATKYQTKIWVNHERRYHPVYRYFRDSLLEGKFGNILKIHASVLTSFQDPGHAFSKEGVGPLYHDGTHAVDFLQWLLGEPKKIKTKMDYFPLPNQKINKKIELRVLSWMEYSNNVHVFLEVGGYRKYFQFEIDIQTSTNRIILSNDGFQFYQAKPSKLYKNFFSLVEEKLPIPPKELKKSNPFINLYESIWESIAFNKEVKTGGIEDNIIILKILDRIQRSC